MSTCTEQNDIEDRLLFRAFVLGLGFGDETSNDKARKLVIDAVSRYAPRATLDVINVSYREPILYVNTGPYHGLEEIDRFVHLLSLEERPT